VTEKPRGRFLVLEGVEGAGKSTQAALLSSWLQEEGVEHMSTREPGGTGVGEAIREILLHGEDLWIPSETELLLLLAARAAFVRSVVQPALERGEWVLADRFQGSTFAYQGFGRGLPLDPVRELNRFATGGVEPDLVILLDITAEAGRARQATEGKAPDRFEAGGETFLERVASGYRALAREEKGWVVLDGARPAAAVHDSVRDLLRTRFPETFHTRQA